MTPPDAEAVERAFNAFWNELCPAIRLTPEDKAHYLPAVRAALSAAGEREAVIEECAEVLDKRTITLAFKSAREVEQGDFHAAQLTDAAAREAADNAKAIRALKSPPSNNGEG